MIVGDPMLRSLNASNPDSSYLNYRCLAADDSNGGPVASPGTSSKAFFADRKCVGGVRAEATFPSCWDGVNLDMPDHKVRTLACRLRLSVFDDDHDTEPYDIPSPRSLSVHSPHRRSLGLLGDRMGHCQVLRLVGSE